MFNGDMCAVPRVRALVSSRHPVVISLRDEKSARLPSLKGRRPPGGEIQVREQHSYFVRFIYQTHSGHFIIGHGGSARRLIEGQVQLLSLAQTPRAKDGLAAGMCQTSRERAPLWQLK
jgi:hypothetical protein